MRGSQAPNTRDPANGSSCARQHMSYTGKSFIEISGNAPRACPPAPVPIENAKSHASAVGWPPHRCASPAAAAGARIFRAQLAASADPAPAETANQPGFLAHYEPKNGFLFRSIVVSCAHGGGGGGGGKVSTSVRKRRGQQSAQMAHVREKMAHGQQKRQINAAKVEAHT